MLADARVLNKLHSIQKEKTITEIFYKNINKKCLFWYSLLNGGANQNAATL